MREEFESTMMRGYTYNDGDYGKWLLRMLSDVEFAMGEIHGPEVLGEHYDARLKRSRQIRAEILSFFPDPVVN